MSMPANSCFGTLIVTLCCYFNCFGQAEISSNYFFERDTIPIGYGETFTNLLRFQNSGLHPVTFIKTNVTPGALLNLPDSVTVEAGKTKTFPVKYLSSAATVQNAIQIFSASYTSPQIKQKDKAVFYATINTESRLSLIPIDPVSYLNNATNRFNIRLRFANDGYTPVHLTLKISSYPTGLQITTPVQQIITMAAVSKQIVIIDGINLNKDKFASDYNVTVEALDPAGKSLATSSIKVISLRSDKIQNLGQTHYAGLETNSTALNYTSTNQGYSFYNLQANGNFQSPDSTGLSYNANVNYYQQEQRMDVYDSWIGYREKKFAVQIGNVSDNLDFPIYGRGIKASAFINNKNSIDIFGLQNNYMLFSASRQLPGAYIFGGNYNVNTGLNNNSKLTFLYSRNPNTGITTYFTNGTARFTLSENEHIEVRGGLSSEASDLKTNLGYASGINYYKRTQRLEVGMNNYYSTAYYSGMQRGVLLLDERLSYNVNTKTTLFLRYNYNKNAPEYQQTQSFLTGYGSKTISYETGVSFAYGRVNFGFRPYLLKQDLNRAFLLAGTETNLNASSYRTELAASFNLGGKQFNILADYGITNSILSGRKKTNGGFKANASVSNRLYSISALVQTAPYYLTDLLSLQDTDQEFRLYALGPGIHVDGLKDRVNLSANYYLSYLSSNIGWNNSLTGNVNIRVKKTWNMTGQVAYNSNTNFPGNYNLQSQIGIVKHFSNSTAPGNAKLEIEFYGDDNANGLRDRNEKVMEGIISNLVPAGNTSSTNLNTISNKNGKVSYANLKKEAYSLHVTHGADRHLNKPLDILLTKNQKLEVPLVRSGWLKGRINALKQDYIASHLVLEGMRILAKDANNQSFETYTNEMGEFEFPLPLNEYVITADVDLEKFKVVDIERVIQVLQKNNADIAIDIIDISRKVIVTQF